MSKKFDRVLANATDSSVLETDWDAVLECVDLIRGGEVPAKAAVQLIQKKMMDENPHVQMHALTLLEAAVKNCGKKVHQEIATMEFMEDVKNLAFEAKAEPVKNKVLELLQCWAMAFASKPEYKIIVDTHNLMKLAGYDFPSIKETEAMFAAQVAPEWEDGANCFRCRAEFGIITRKHHCRACGQIFCGSCSSKEMLLPQFGIEKAVRVCDACFDKGVGVAPGRPSSTVRKFNNEAVLNEPAYGRLGNGLPPVGNEPGNLALPAPAQRKRSEGFLKNVLKKMMGRSASRQRMEDLQQTLSRSEMLWEDELHEPQAVPKELQKESEDQERERREREKAEEEEYQVQLALALSQSEAEAKEQERQKSLYSMYNGVKNEIAGSTSGVNVPATAPEGFSYKGASENARIPESPSETSLSTEDPLARYLNRDYWQQKKKNAEAVVSAWETNPSAPLPSEPSIGGGSCVATVRGSPVPGQNGVYLRKEDVVPLTTGPLLDDSTQQKSEETTKFCRDIQEQVESMENRIRSNVARGRPILNDTAIQGLYMRLTELHAQVIGRMNEQENQRTYYESLQDHLSHIGEAREAINALREEEERKRAELAAEEQRMRQTQMQHKLAYMRQQKHEMLLYQRQVALQRFQHQEAEMAARRQQQMSQPQQYYGYQPMGSMAMPAASQAAPVYSYPAQQYGVVASQQYQQVPQPQQYMHQAGQHQYQPMTAPMNGVVSSASGEALAQNGYVAAQQHQHVPQSAPHQMPQQANAAAYAPQGHSQTPVQGGTPVPTGMAAQSPHLAAQNAVPATGSTSGYSYAQQGGDVAVAQHMTAPQQQPTYDQQQYQQYYQQYQAVNPQQQQYAQQHQVPQQQPAHQGYAPPPAPVSAAPEETPREAMLISFD